MFLGPLILSLLGAADASPLADSPQGYGIGVVSGAVTGLAPVYRPSPRSTIGGAVGWNFRDSSMNVQADYKQNMHEIAIEEGTDIVLRLNVGGGVFGDFYDSYTQVGIYVPFGVTLIPDQRPFDLFLDLSPGMAVAPATRFVARWTVGARVYFR
jgi:hypothetical protein